MAQLSTQQITRDGLEPSFAAAAELGDKFTNDPRTFVIVRNDAGAQMTVTFDIQSTVDGQAVADREVDIPAGEQRLVGPFTDSYSDSDGNVNMTYSSETDVFVAAIKL